MNIALCYCAKDRDQAERLGGWLIELGPFPRHTFLIFRHADCTPIAAFESFATGEQVIYDDVFNSWPQSANHAFKKAAKHVEYTSRQPFLWLEPDAVPLHGKAFDLIEDEYKRIGKHFLGDIINDGKGFMPHMSGIGVYPGSISNTAGEIYFAGSEPWDVYAAGQILPQAGQSEYILHRWKAPPLISYGQISANILSVRPKCALFHSDKSGNLITLLRGGTLPTPDTQPVVTAPVTAPVIPPPRVLPAELPPHPITPNVSPANPPTIKTPDPTGDYWIGQKPWENKKETMAEIHLLADRLGKFCGQGSRSRSVLIALHEAKVIKLKYRPKKKLKKAGWNNPGRGKGPKPPGWRPRYQIRAEKKAAKEAAIALERENAGNQ